jgi:mono/diheme cytochrome c family protein
VARGIPTDLRRRVATLTAVTRVRAVMLACAIAAAVAAGCGGSPVATPDAADLANGKTQFQQKCGGCHTLEDAGSRGTLGPNLDQAYLGPRLQGFEESSFEALVRQQIVEAEPPMPKDLVTGDDARDVSAYVASVAAVQLAKQQGGSAAASG